MGDYLLFFSSKCLHCKELLTLFSKDFDLNQKFLKISVDNPNFKIPPYIKSVPSAIIPTNGQPKLLVGNDIFKWFNASHTKTVEKLGIQDWDPHTMTGYSDGFSYIENPEVIKKSFAFLNDTNNNIITPDENSYSGNNNEKNQPKTKLDNDYEQFVNQRKYEVPSSAPRI
jgi:hypothetical protein